MDYTNDVKLLNVKLSNQNKQVLNLFEYNIRLPYIPRV